MWVYCCSWRIERDGHSLAGSGDLREQMGVAIGHLEQKQLNSFEVWPSGDALIQLESGISLKLFATQSAGSDDAHWMLFMPEGQVLVIGPGNDVWIEENGRKLH